MQPAEGKHNVSWLMKNIFTEALFTYIYKCCANVMHVSNIAFDNVAYNTYIIYNYIKNELIQYIQRKNNFF